MKIRVSELRIGIDEDTNILKQLACQKLKVSASQVKNWWIERQSLDARRKKEIAFVYTIVLDLEEQITGKIKEPLPPKSSIVDQEEEYLNIRRGVEYLKYPPLVVGTGPSGLFAAWLLAKWGYKPIVLERGKSVFARQRDVARFWDEGELDPESNVQFGEGGAGTFSDGKLTTRIKDKRVNLILQALTAAGAPEEILYQAKPHLGTDRLRNIVANIRKEIISLGGKVLFQARVTDFMIKKGVLEAVEVNHKHELPVSRCILATGHSARDTYEKLWKINTKLEAKPFAIGLRVEHPQHMIDCAQYGEWAGNPRLGAADYHLTYRNTNLNRAAYSFCMCPGGYVIGASSEPEMLAVNGMSYHDRSSGTSNSAVVVTVGERDYDYKNPLSGIKFQRQIEGDAYHLGGGNYTAPVQTVDDFINDTVKETPSRLKQATYKPDVKEANLRDCLPKEIGEVLGEALQDFNKKIWGFGTNKGILTGVETRTSAPLRIPRDDKYQALDIEGLYPTGEGAGYAGGIMSAAVDGIRVAQSIIEAYGLPKEEIPTKIIEGLSWIEGEE
ncbi:NAD(P)/FAD-dependent oxidoreductase [Desulfitibacter alkalitolerans]|uniref:NAD(P)/FAD-dependent oxidoreductase n=1 Tax=Desulfitibacter alkalitolerans TaxID=264641 RepID=UPI00048474EA|nr:NAD(P)-binding protein [Desulfitibacter alkalitolerans]